MRREWERQHPPPRDEATWTEYAKTVFRTVEKWMDAGYGQRWFRQPDYSAELSRTILHFTKSGMKLGRS